MVGLVGGAVVVCVAVGVGVGVSLDATSVGLDGAVVVGVATPTCCLVGIAAFGAFARYEFMNSCQA